MIYAGKLENDAARPRLGVTVSRRIGNAIVRNRIKRRVRESFRIALRELLPPGASIVVIARAGADRLRSDAIRTELSAAAGMAGARLRGASK